MVYGLKTNELGMLFFPPISFLEVQNQKMFISCVFSGSLEPCCFCLKKFHQIGFYSMNFSIFQGGAVG